MLPRFIWIGSLTLVLSGCIAGIPPAVMIASYAADGVSYVATGKSVSDHAISAVAEQDCAMFRLIILEHPCRDWEHEATMVAGNYEDDGDWSAWRPEVQTAARGSGGATTVAARSGVPTRDYLVIGSFSRLANARRMAAAHKKLKPVVVAAKVGSRRYYRVAAPVRLAPTLDAAKRKLARAGFRNVWAISLCTSGAAGSQCPPAKSDPSRSPEAVIAGRAATESVSTQIGEKRAFGHDRPIALRVAPSDG